MESSSEAPVFTNCPIRRSIRWCCSNCTPASGGASCCSLSARFIQSGSGREGTHKMAEAKIRKMTFGVVVGNRGFFPGHLAESGHAEMIAVLEKAGHGVVALGLQEARHGAVESRAEATACADLFRKHAG